nr:hypothetical protein [Microbacterium sp. NIBRBAC000506063]
MIREWWALYLVGIWLYMALVPPVEAAEQTVIQKVVPFTKQGRVFGVAAALESAAAPVTAFLIAPIAEFWVIPYMNTAAGQERWGWLLGEGQARGIALICFFAGLIMVVVALLAFRSRAYKQLTELYAKAPEPAEGDDEESDAGARPVRHPSSPTPRRRCPERHPLSRRHAATLDQRVRYASRSMIRSLM